MLTSDAGRPSCWNEKVSNAKPSQIDACFTERKLPNITNQMRQMLLNRSAFCSKIPDDGQDALRVAGLPE